MSNEIKRWDIAALGNGFTGMKHRDDGAFVRTSDHEAEVGRLRAEVYFAAKAALDATALACEKEREADALRVDAERRLALIRSTLENSEWRHGSRNIHAELSREVNAAVGEGK